MTLSAISMNSALADKEFVLSLHHKLMMYTNTINQLFTQSINHYYINNNEPPSVMKLSPGIYSKKESCKTESHKANLTV